MTALHTPTPTTLPDGTTITWGTSITNPYAVATLSERARIDDFLTEVPTLSTSQYLTRVADLLYQTANMNSRGIICRDYDAKTSAAYQESVRRLTSGGHAPRCASGLYRRAYNQAMRMAGLDASTECDCTCADFPEHVPTPEQVAEAGPVPA